MTRTVVVTSGKGGVGKTTTSASFASGLALRGHKTAVIDFDVGLRNLDLIMGCERRVVYDLVNVINGEANLHQALIKDKHCENLSVLAASQTRDKEALTKEGVEKVLGGLSELGFEYIVCDSPAGIETGAMMAMHFADEALVVTNPEVSSVRDSDRILGMLGEQDQARHRGRRAGQGAPADHPLQHPAGAPGRDAVARRRAGHPADQDDRRHPRVRDGAAILQPGRAGRAHERLGRLRGLQGHGRPLPRRRKAAALRQRIQAGLLQASFRGKLRRNGLIPFFSSRPEKNQRQGRQGAAADHPGARARTGRRRQPGYLSSLQRELVDVVCKYIKIDPKDIKVNLERQENLDVLEVKIELPEAR
jgi:cell division topological specificity factor MinE